MFSMKVYRVEQRHYGHGPYIVPIEAYPSPEDDDNYYEACRIAGILCQDHSGSSEHPPPRDITPAYYCAFELRADLDRWFADHIDTLREGDLTLRVYETEDYYLDIWGQVTFRKDSAKTLTTETI